MGFSLVTPSILLPGLMATCKFSFGKVFHISRMLEKGDCLYTSVFFPTRYIPTFGLCRSNSGELDIVSTWPIVWVHGHSVCSCVFCSLSLWWFIELVYVNTSFLLVESLAKISHALVYILTFFLFSFSWDTDLCLLRLASICGLKGLTAHSVFQVAYIDYRYQWVCLWHLFVVVLFLTKLT